MTYLFVGAGQAGSAIVDAIFEHTDDSLLDLFSTADISTLGRPIVFNSTIRDLENLSNVPREQQYGIAEQHGLVEGNEPGFEEMVTGGFGRDPVKADEVMDEHAAQVHGVLDAQVGEAVPPDPDEDVAPESSDSVQFAFLFLGLGGGTGCGIAPHLAREINSYTDGRAQVIAIGILPATGTDDEEGANAGRQAWNARYGLDRLEPEVDGIVLVDNERISYLDSAAGQFGKYNEYVAAALHDLIAGPVFNTVDASEVEGVDTPDIDVRDIVTSLSFGVGGGDSTPGYAAIGRSVSMTRSLSGYLLPFVGRREIDSAALSRLSTSKQTVARADPGDAEKAIALVRAPSSYIADGSKGIETATIQEHLERSSGLSEVNLGVAINERQLASVTSLLTYQRSELRRLDEIEAAADAYEDETEQLV
ncbi:MAG: cell division protein FtsZ [Halanaeroarchaeum sp.]